MTARRTCANARIRFLRPALSSTLAFPIKCSTMVWMFSDPSCRETPPTSAASSLIVVDEAMLRRATGGGVVRRDIVGIWVVSAGVGGLLLWFGLMLSLKAG